jgi:PAS domain S-box-containing protein
MEKDKITLKKQTDAGLQKSEELYHRLVETMQEGLGVADQNYQFTFVNERFCEMLGYHRDEIIGRYLLDFVHDDYRESMKDQMARRQKGLEKKFELVWKTKDGKANGQ